VQVRLRILRGDALRPILRSTGIWGTITAITWLVAYKLTLTRTDPSSPTCRPRMRTKLHVFCFDLPQSDACFVKAYPAETTEAFLDGHVSAFAFFGGVPISILYDNLKIAVARSPRRCARRSRP
jgi:transposase